MSHPIKDHISWLRADAKRFRGLAKIQRQRARDAKAKKDWIEVLKAEERVREYVRAALQRDADAKEYRLRLSTPTVTDTEVQS